MYNQSQATGIARSNYGEQMTENNKIYSQRWNIGYQL